jgi:signal peptidase II
MNIRLFVKDAFRTFSAINKDYDALLRGGEVSRRDNLKKKYIVLFMTVAVVTLCDFITKAYISSTMTLHESFVVVGGFLNITYVRNPGAAFSFLADAPAIFRSIFFTSVAVFAIVLALYYIAKSKIEEPLMIYSLSLILSGAVGNLIDRVRFGEVIDFIDVYISSYHWPAFNVADSAITVGAVIMILQLTREKKKQGGSASA